MNSSNSTVSEPIADLLQKALQQAQGTLAQHAAHLPSALLADLDLLQQDYGRQHVRIAVCGEVKAGKSTLLNAIAGAALSPVAFDPLTSVPVRVTHGPTTTWRIGAHTLANLTELESRMRQEHEPEGEVIIETNLDLLQLGGQVELWDTPGMGSDAHTDSISAEALRTLDAIVLVVRYPALFTEYTRQLVRSLSHDISKLFVVWNLDASCRELTRDEQDRHAATLRTNAAGAHDLHLVDAQRGFDAAKNQDDAARESSGLSMFTAALGEFLNSNSRAVVALREAAKRGLQLLTSAQEDLATRKAAVDMVIDNARRQLKEVDSKADAQCDKIRAELADVATMGESLLARNNAAGSEAATKLRKALKTARRRWVWNGRLADLDATVTSALQEFANAVNHSGRSAASDLENRAKSMGAKCTLSARPMTIPKVDALAPEDRGNLAVTGRWQLIRRALWPSWYLEGLNTLDQQLVTSELQQQTAWLEQTAKRAYEAAAASGEARMKEIDSQRAADKQRIEEETELATYNGEAELLVRNAPVVEALLAKMTDLATRARANLED